MSSDAGGGTTMPAPIARRMSSAWVHVSKARTSSAICVGARRAPPVDRLVEAGLAPGRDLRVGRLGRSLQLGDGLRRRAAGVTGPGLRGAALVVGGGLGDAGHRHAELVGEQRLVGHQVDRDVVDGPAGELGRVDGAVPVVDRQVAEEQDRPAPARRGGRRSARRRRPPRPAPGGGVPRRARGTAGRGRGDVGDDGGGELAGGRAQVLLPADGVGAGVEVGGDGGGVLGVVGVECVGGQIVR